VKDWFNAFLSAVFILIIFLAGCFLGGNAAYKKALTGKTFNHGEYRWACYKIP